MGRHWSWLHLLWPSLGRAAALCNLDIIERENLTQNAATTGEYLQMKMKAAFADHPLIGDSVEWVYCMRWSSRLTALIAVTLIPA
ncbi:hypothetical protein [Salinivibrio socompensis]|uniref:hypothetical protein n=1 Tax=Salinivibrio socompensis TaxID=1510206 RepID=UPI0004B6FC31|nr:hypothetical protein [Salinivibrio socompensis]